MSVFRRWGTPLDPSEGSSAAVRASRRAGRPVLATFAYLVSLGLVAVLLVEPTGFSSAATLASASARGGADPATQSVLVTGAADIGHARDAFDVVKLPPPPPPVSRSAPAAGIPDPGTAQAIAYDMVAARGWGQGEFDCLVALWNKESRWNVYAHNRSSGAYGIPQALPGEKMASAGADWATNPATQITWGLGYIAGRYGTPCGAWAASQAKGWY